ncbi:MAG: hypothetical protein RLY30_161 [Pseudomonadota bacterium]|jgi:glycerol-3-phosphate acyltransferase PlsY
MSPELLASDLGYIVAWLLLVAYGIGSISAAIVVSRVRGLADPRSYGSKNPGATNMLRTGDRLAAALTLLGDALKGWLAVKLAALLMGEVWPVLCAVGLVAFLGHLYPMWHRFQGGKGVATALGVLLALSPAVGLACLVSWLVVFKLSKISSLSALSAALLAPIWWWLLGPEGGLAAQLMVMVMAALLLYRHKQNIRDLRAGREERSALKAANAAEPQSGPPDAAAPAPSESEGQPPRQS